MFFNNKFEYKQAIQQAAKQSRNKQRAPPPVGSQSTSNAGTKPRSNVRNYNNNSSQGPLTQLAMSQNMMSQPGLDNFSQSDFPLDQSQGGDGILSQDFTNSQGPDKFYGNFSQSQNF